MPRRSRSLITVTSALSLLAFSLGSVQPAAASVTPRVSLPMTRLEFGVTSDQSSEQINWLSASGVPWKYRYQYLAGGVYNSWQSWNAGAMFPVYYIQNTPSTTIPVFTYYMLLQSHRSSDEKTDDYNNLNNSSLMNAYYSDFRTLLQRIHSQGRTTVVHVEPDFWGYMQQEANNGAPTSVSASVSSSGFGDVSGYPNNVAGFAQALLHLRNLYAPEVVMGAHASMWSSSVDVGATVGTWFTASTEAAKTATFLKATGSWDVIFNDVDDHDAGYQEQNGDNSGFTHWWDPTITDPAAAHPNFARYLSWVATLHAVTGLPQVAWQVPIGNQYMEIEDNSWGHYQDNRVEYFTSHASALAAAGLVAVLFGAGNPGQTVYTDDDGDGVNNGPGHPTVDPATVGWCSGCNTHASIASDDDGGYLRLAVGQYYAGSTGYLTAPCTPTAGSPPAGSAYYFAEGYTGPGFTEQLALLEPTGGIAFVDYYTPGAHSSCTVTLVAGQPTLVDVSQAVGASEQVSARVTFSGFGVAERLQSFNNGAWHGSTDLVGARQAASEWDFAEGSTLSAFSEYLTLQNPTGSSVTVDLNYFTDSIGHPTRKLVLSPLSRTTVEVFSGSSAPGPIVNCVPFGTGASCGVGRGIQGVSVQVLAEGGAQIVAERPFYVNGLSFGSGSIYDGHVALGANGPALRWYLAEGTTLASFNEFLTIQNPNSSPANLTIAYQTDTGANITRTYQVPALARATLQVWDGSQAGFGWGGVSTQVSSNVPVVVERPMYMVHDFGAGTVAGATDVVGATSFAQSFSFAYASTLGSDRAYLTVQNAQGTAANLSLTYYLATGTKTVSTSVPAGSRKTITVADGAGSGQAPIGVQITSSQPVLVEKPTYSASPATYGATDTVAATG